MADEDEFLRLEVEEKKETEQDIQHLSGKIEEEALQVSHRIREKYDYITLFMLGGEVILLLYGLLILLRQVQLF